MRDEPPVPYDALRDLFEYLDRTSATGYECDHSFTLARRFIAERHLPGESFLEWLQQNGAGCDCEIIFNVAQQWEEVVGFEPKIDESDA
jgi:hypothetical protein